LQILEQELKLLSFHFDVIVVNDCSTDNTLPLLQQYKLAAGNMRLYVLDLAINAGHQAAIYQGIEYAAGLDPTYAIIMDCDGQDSAATVTALLSHSAADIVHVVRSSRQEPIWFRACYFVYKTLFRVVTGKQMNYGNFSRISPLVMRVAVGKGFIHFAAFLSGLQVSRGYIKARRERRLGGASKMSFIKHFGHAVRSFSQYYRQK
jgi:glycosyltransferase involved in cell wall biosynthesis